MRTSKHVRALAPYALRHVTVAPRHMQEIKDRDNTISEKEKRIYDLKKKNQELEKFKFVLDHKIKELKKQIEPKDDEIADMRDQIKVRAVTLTASRVCACKYSPRVLCHTQIVHLAEAHIAISTHPLVCKRLPTFTVSG